MTATVLPFPETKRIDSIRRLATMMARYSPEAAERALAMPLYQKHEALLRRGIAPDAAAREMRAFESAVRTYAFGLIARGNGGGVA